MNRATVPAKGKARQATYRQGWNEGYRYGGCLAIMEQTPITLPVKGGLRILYVQQGFESVDQGMIAALRAAAGVLEVAAPEEMLQKAEQNPPDLVLVMNALHVFPAEHSEHIDLLRSRGIRTAVWFVDDPYYTDRSLPLAGHYDYVFTHELSCVSVYREGGCSEVHYLPLAADLERFAPMEPPRSYQSDICFIGSGFWNRVALFDQLAPYLASKKVSIIGGLWSRLQQQKLLGPHIREGWVGPEEARIYYNGAKIVINMHRPTEAGQDNANTANLPGLSINPRTYEIAACGALQITDIREDLGRYYRPGYDIETFASAEELERKIQYYLTHEQERTEIAWRSLRTTRERHAYHDRVARMLAIVK